MSSSWFRPEQETGIKSLNMTIFVTSQMNYYSAQQRVGYHKRKSGPHNQIMVRTLQGGGHVSR